MNKKTLYFLFKLPHAALDLLYNEPPENLKIIFKDSKNPKGSISSKKQFKANNQSLKNKIIFLIRDKFQRGLLFFNIPLILPVFPINKFHYDYLFHEQLVLSNKKFICYIDYIGNLIKWNDEKLKSKYCLAIIKKFFLSKRCKYIFFWSKIAKKMLIDVLNIPKTKQHKFKTIYPTIKPKLRSKRNDNKIRLLAISSVAKFDKDFNFFMKGGKLLLEAYEKLKPKYKNLQLSFVGYIPSEYRYLKNLPDVDFDLRVPYDKIMNLYSQADIFIFPTYADVFGFAFLEAMAYGLPIICLNNNSTAPELVLNNKTGFVVETSQKFLYFPFSKYCPDWISKMKYYENLKTYDDVIGLNNLIEKLELLIQNKELREKLGENGRSRITDGKLSLKHRNAKLFKLFSDS